ncbi:MAG: cytochrome c [Candidatus Latescibacteria bacterium]|nr:cytochrome c [Candidatus Latescibacterota bacterium]
MRHVVLIIVVLLTAVGCQFLSRTTSSETTTVTTADTTVVADTVTVESRRLTYLEQKGKRLFLHYCAICHGETGAGDGFNAYNLNPRPRNLTDPQFSRAVSDAWLAEIIAQGGRGVNKSPLMPSWGNTLNARQIEAIVAFIRRVPQPQQ